jgi:mannose-6-phosphate isomerase-like protein (cupin superfamily)
MSRNPSHPRRRAVPALAGAAVLALAALAPAFAAPAGPARTRTPEQQEAQSAAEAIERALRKHGPDVHRCFERALADRLDAAGSVEVEVEVGAGGRVTAAKLEPRDSDAPPELAACVEAAARGWTIAGVEPGASVVLPFAFEGQLQQFVIKAADAPVRTLAAAKGAPRGPFTVKVLVDPVNARSADAALTLLNIGPASRVAMHRHPRSSKILYLLKGRARILGPTGSPPIKADPGTAIFLPPGYPHVIENMGRQVEAVFLQAFAPPGPERAYRDPKNPEARADFEVLRDPRVKAPPGSKPVVRTRDEARALSIFGGKGRARILFDEKVTGSPAMALSVLEFSAGAELPRHEHQGSSEILYVLSGGGKMTVGSETTAFGPETALYVPPGQPHAAHIGGGGPTEAIQIYAPAGPEQRFREPAAK